MKPFPFIERAKLSAPWQGQLLALTAALIMSGNFDRRDFMQKCETATGMRLSNGTSLDADDACRDWLRQMETMLIEMELLTETEIEEAVEAWKAAFLSAPH